MGLCCPGGLRGLWGFCTRVELGGYMTCGVFASVFLLLLLCLPPFVLCPSLVWLSLLVLLSCLSGFVFVVSFSLADYAQKERAQSVCPLRPLLSCCVCSDSCAVIEKLLRCVFGFFQFVRLIMPTNTASI